MGSPSVDESKGVVGHDPDLAETTLLGGTGGGDEAPVERLPRGTNVGRYVIIDVVGSGGMGVVYSAFDPELDRKVALKLLRPEARVNAENVRARDRLLREAQAMAKLSHPNVLPVFDVGTYENAVFVALEFVEGETMRAWIERTNPPWPRALEVMIAAARGLSAAHAEGLVHRDFKPENVLIGRRGDVRVMDFGLARAATDTEPGESTVTEGRTSDVVDGVHLTKTGFVLGTPAYMAPEQHRGVVIDARADQFALAVSLYEAVYGERPFAGRVASEVMAATLARQVRPPPRGSTVPRWLRRAILRGLAPDPAERWPSVDALLAEVGRDRRGPVRIGVLLASTTAIAVVAGFAYGRNADTDSPCATHADDLAEVFSPARRTAIAAQFAATGLPYAPETWTRVEADLATYADAWTAARLDACEATRVRAEQSDATMERRGFCLDHRKAQLDALLGVFEVADAEVVARAVAGAAGLEPPASCASASVLGGNAPLPPAEIVAEIERLRGELARVRTLRDTARLADAQALATTTREAAIGLEYAPLVAEARVAVGQTMTDLGQFEEAAAELTAAVDLAEAQAMDALVAAGELALVRVVGEKLLRGPEAERWAEACAAKLRRLGGDDRLEARLLMARSGVADEAGQYDASRRYAEASLELWNHIEGSGPDRVAALGNLGRVAYRAQHFETALADFERAHDAAIATYGPRHPEIGKLLSNIATAKHAMGDIEGAGAALDQSLALFEAVLPPDHPDIATTLTNISAFAYRSGRYEYAIEVSQRVIEMRRRTLGPRSPKVAGSLNNQAISLLALGRVDEALAAYREAVALYEEAFPAGHPDLSAMLLGVGEILLRKQDFEGAAANLERAVAIGSGPGVNPYANAEAKFLLARALWDATGARDRRRAHTLAEAAAVTLRSAPEHEQKHLESIEAWLREHAS